MSGPAKIPSRLLRSTGFALLLALTNLGATQEKTPQQERTTATSAPPRTQSRFADSALTQIPPLVKQALTDGEMAGAVVAIGDHTGIQWIETFGHRQLEPNPVPMTRDTVFDLASLTKPLATGLSLMKLVEQGKVRLRDPFTRYLPEFAVAGKETITVQQLLTHTSGLTPDNALADYTDGVELAWQRMEQLEPRVEPGSRFMYSDVGFLILGRLIERVSGKTLDEFAQIEIYQPLSLADTAFTPEPNQKQRAAATHLRDGKWIVGDVHDPRSFLLNGVAGHAGLFSTADDLATLSQALLNGLQGRQQTILRQTTLLRMTADHSVPGGHLRGLGWDKQSSYSSNRGELFSNQAFGHGGFTGTSLWIDPELDLFVVFLSNRLHPDGKGYVNRLAGTIGTLAAASLRPGNLNTRTSEPTPVLPGADQLVANDLAAIRGKRVALLTNHTGRLSNNRSIASVLLDSKDCQLTTLLVPTPCTADSLDPRFTAPDSATNVQYIENQQTSLAPETLADTDILLFDLQNMGTRFDPSISLLFLAMEAAAQAEIPMIVLDRPNPLGGLQLAGPLANTGQLNKQPGPQLPVQHGLTLGELALLGREENSLSLDLNIIACRPWSRATTYLQTGMPWNPPTAHIANYQRIALYPGLSLIEMTNVSLGQGTNTPYEVVGAPWVNGPELANKLNHETLPGVRFIPTRFTPTSHHHASESCQGVLCVITNFDQFQPVQTGLAIAKNLHRLYEGKWQDEGLSQRLDAPSLMKDLLSEDADLAEINAHESNDLDEFRKRRRPHLIYPD